MPQSSEVEKREKLVAEFLDHLKLFVERKILPLYEKWVGVLNVLAFFPLLFSIIHVRIFYTYFRIKNKLSKFSY